MPTYNDYSTIIESLNSIINQDYQNYEILISDDGSTDNTKELLTKYINEHSNINIKYFYQENQDQLNAINNVLDESLGDYIYIFHSDDVFASNHVLSDVAIKINELEEKYDAYIASESFLINENSQGIGKQYFKSYSNKEYIIPLNLLWLGRNFYWDVAFFKSNIFKTKVKNNYLIWNTPFWLNYEYESSMLKVKTLNMDFMKYRVFEGNYINNEIGKLNVINGELRTATRLMKFYHLPFYKIQYFIFRLFNKINLNYKPIYKKQETKNKYKIIKFIIEKRYKESEYKNNLFLNNLLNFYKNYQPRSITIDKIDDEEFIYYGKDIRKFNKKLLKNELSPLYLFMLKEMGQGFDEIITTKKNKEKVEVIVKFLCLFPFVKIKIKN